MNYFLLCKFIVFYLVFQAIFSRLTITTKVFMGQAIIRITPFTRGQDELSMLKNDLDRNIVANISHGGQQLNIFRVGPVSDNFDFEYAMNRPAYRLNIDVRSIVVFNSGKWLIRLLFM